jgi:hypothetical protein
MRLAAIKKLLDEAPLGEHLDCTFGFEKLKTFSLDVKETRKTLDAFSYALTPPDMLEHALTGLLNCFYPADNLRDNKALAYYRQREWRIAWNFAVRGEEVMRRSSEELVRRLLEIDSEFFARDFQTATGTSQIAHEAYAFPGVGGKKIIQLVNRIVVPRGALQIATTMIARVAPGVTIVCLEDL